MNLDASPPLGVTGEATVICLESPLTLQTFRHSMLSEKRIEGQEPEFARSSQPYQGLFLWCTYYLTFITLCQILRSGLQAAGEVSRHRYGRPLYAARESAFLWQRLDLGW